MAGTVTTKGLGEFIRACDAAGKETKKLVRDKLRDAARPVLEAAKSKLSPYDEKSASRLGISVRRTGLISVEQRLGRTTGQRPNFGSLQMVKALIPALDENTDKVMDGMEKALDEIVDEFRRS